MCRPLRTTPCSSINSGRRSQEMDSPSIRDRPTSGAAVLSMTKGGGEADGRDGDGGGAVADVGGRWMFCNLLLVLKSQTSNGREEGWVGGCGGAGCELVTTCVDLSSAGISGGVEP